MAAAEFHCQSMQSEIVACGPAGLYDAVTNHGCLQTAVQAANLLATLLPTCFYCFWTWVSSPGLPSATRVLQPRSIHTSGT